MSCQINTNGCLRIDFSHRPGDSGDAVLAGHVFDFKCDHGFLRQNGLKKASFILASMGRSMKSCLVPYAEMFTPRKF